MLFVYVYFTITGENTFKMMFIKTINKSILASILRKEFKQFAMLSDKGNSGFKMKQTVNHHNE